MQSLAYFEQFDCRVRAASGYLRTHPLHIRIGAQSSQTRPVSAKCRIGVQTHCRAALLGLYFQGLASCLQLSGLRVGSLVSPASQTSPNLYCRIGRMCISLADRHLQPLGSRASAICCRVESMAGLPSLPEIPKAKRPHDCSSCQPPFGTQSAI